MPDGIEGESELPRMFLQAGQRCRISEMHCCAVSLN